MTSTKKDIRALSEAQIIDILKEKGEAKFYPVDGRLM